MEIGALVDVNTLALAYGDDTLLLASNDWQMQKFVNSCADYAVQWKLSFNPLKLSCYSNKPVDYEFILNGGCIPKAEGFIYLEKSLDRKIFFKR